MPLRDVALALVIVLVWGLNFVVIKTGLGTVPPLLLVALRFSFAAFPLVFFVRRPAVGWRYLIGWGMILGVAHFGLLFTSMKLGMPSGLASVVLQSQALFTLLLAAAFLSEHRTVAEMAGLCLAAIGLGLIGSAHGVSMTLTGFGLCVLSALMWAVVNILMRELGRRQTAKIDALAFVVWGSLIPPVPLLLLSMFVDGGPAILAALRQFNGSSLAVVAYLAIPGTLVGTTLWNTLLSRHPAGRVAPFSLLVPVVGLIAANLVFDEQLSTQQWLGSLVLMVGLGVNLSGERLFRWVRRSV